MLDPISDMITRIRNAALAGHQEVLIPMSKFKIKIAEILSRKGFVRKTEEEQIDGKKYIRVLLKYISNEKGEKIPYIQGIRRVSREGQRVYAQKGKMPVIRSGFGFPIISTSSGLMTGEEAKRAGVGGEVICEVW